MAVVIGVAGCGYGEVLGSGRACGRRATDRCVGYRNVRVEDGLGNWGRVTL